MIQLEDVTKTYASGGQRVDAMRHVSLQVVEGETLAIVGTSGSGKTTTLRMINGLERPTAGSVQVLGRDVVRTDLIELRRSIGYVIQGAGLFPHMSVAQNVGLLLKLTGRSEAAIAARVDELLDSVALPAARFRDRMPRELSGGEKQRAGIARALALDPPILLLDEPFGALDPLTRRKLQDALLSLQKMLRKTVVLVTHDMSEAVALAGRIAVMDAGEVIQCAPPSELRASPATAFVRDLLEVIGAPARMPRLAEGRPGSPT